MRRERIRSTPSWHHRGPRRDCAFVVEDEEKSGMRGMSVVRVKLFYSFKYDGVEYPCAFVEWFKRVGRARDSAVGMWKVKPDIEHRERVSSVLHLDTFLRGAHLLPTFGSSFLPLDFDSTHALDAFQAYYVNQYADHNSHELVF